MASRTVVSASVVSGEPENGSLLHGIPNSSLLQLSTLATLSPAVRMLANSGRITPNANQPIPTFSMENILKSKQKSDTKWACVVVISHITTHFVIIVKVFLWISSPPSFMVGFFCITVTHFHLATKWLHLQFKACNECNTTTYTIMYHCHPLIYPMVTALDTSLSLNKPQKTIRFKAPKKTFLWKPFDWQRDLWPGHTLEVVRLRTGPRNGFQEAATLQSVTFSPQIYIRFSAVNLSVCLEGHSKVSRGSTTA